jgi:hypothetical protein
MEPSQVLLIVGAAFVMGWFGLGIIWNIRRGNAVLRWMQSGLPVIGEKTTMRWLGSSVVELAINKAKPPFRRFAVTVVMQPRDVPWLWVLSSLNGRRDILILRAQLSGAPRLEYDLVVEGSWSGRLVLKELTQMQWGSQTLQEFQFLAPKASLPVSIADAPSLLETAHNINPVIYRLGIRREYPQMELHIPLPNTKVSDAQRYFESVRQLGIQLNRE